MKSSGFLPEERAEMTRWVEAGWVDTFRAAHPEEEGTTAGGTDEGAEANVGWRIDYVFASASGAGQDAHLAGRHRVGPLPGWRRHRMNVRRGRLIGVCE